MARRTIAAALDQLAEALRSYGYPIEDGYVFELVLPNDVADEIIAAMDTEASAGVGLITDADNPVPDTTTKAPQAIADYKGIIISKRRV